MKNTILICDDDPDILELLKFVFESHSYRVVTQINSVKAIKTMLTEQPDVVLMDLWMPFISGDQIVLQMKEAEQLSNIPVLVMSASREGKDLAYDIGANDFIAKPFDIDEVVTKVDQALDTSNTIRV